MINLIKTLYKDEDGDVIQNIIWIFGGVLATIGAVATLFTTVKGKLTSMNTSINGITTP